MFTAPLLPQSSSRRSWAPLAALGLMLAATAAAAAEQTVRLATFNIALYGTRAGEIRERLHGGGDRQAQALAEIIQRVRPDVLVLNEIDYDEAGATLAAFAEEYLAVAQNVSGVAPPPEPLKYPHRIVFPANTGEHSGFDLDRNGRVDPADGGRDYGGDCWGYGVYPGQYAFALLSQFPLDEGAIRQFRRFLWRDMPGALLPDDPATPDSGDWYS
ncbi:MAG TPA: endonuclease/exonuclease/phosphatase family protein, partial [Lacipirellulaceae bacterium]|nr:endonuclease/exonuclease/phosphatase family protein [Lacipirellulaceae bacterium]